MIVKKLTIIRTIKYLNEKFYPMCYGPDHFTWLFQT